MHPRWIALASLLAAILVLPGCAVSPSHVHRADAVVAADTHHELDCDRADHCAIDSPLLDAAR